MERELWPLLYRELQAAAALFQQKYVHHHPWSIAAELLGASLHDRTISWACQPKNCSITPLRPATLPSQSAVSRRRRRTAFGRELYAGRFRGEQCLGNATAVARGLAGLPAWGRRQHRVEQWVWAKRIINAVRIRKKQGVAA